MLEREDPRKVQALLQAVGLCPDDFALIPHAPSEAEAIERLNAVKAKFKAGFRKLAHELHPDKPSNDPSKAEQLRILLLIRDHVEKLRVSTPLPARRAVTIHYYPGERGQARAHTTVDPLERARRVSTMGPSVRWVRTR